MSRTRVLLIAEAANPEAPSIPLVGWSHARALAQLADVHMVVQIRSRDAILRAGLKEGVDFTAIDSSGVETALFRIGEFVRGGWRKQWTSFSAKGWTTHTAFSVFSYYYFEHLLWNQFRTRLRAGEFDVVHRVLPLTPVTPSLLAGKCRAIGVPFVLGPINGGVPWPKGFEEIQKSESEWVAALRSLHKVFPGYRSTRKNATAIMAGSRITLAEIPAAYRDKCVYVPENGINMDQFAPVPERPVELPLRVAFVGRLVPLKGVDMLLEAAAPLIAENKIRVDVIGDGPEMERLRKIVTEGAMEHGVRLDGWVEHTRLHERLCESDVFAFPSIREFGGGVLVEAMAMGLVPIVLDYAGPAEIVTPKTGFIIPMGNRDHVVKGLRNVLQQLATDPSAVAQMRQNARKRMESCFTWDVKARQTMAVYDWVLGKRTEKPDFGTPLADVWD